MTTLIKWLMVVGIGLGATSSEGGLALTAAPDNPYRPILERNAFRLQPAAQSKTEPKPVTPEPTITLRGIVTYLCCRAAVLNVQLPATQGRPSSQFSLMLDEGESQAGIELLHIDNEGSGVIVKVSGKEIMLSL